LVPHGTDPTSFRTQQEFTKYVSISTSLAPPGAATIEFKLVMVGSVYVQSAEFRGFGMVSLSHPSELSKKVIGVFYRY
jgi:hypothetical protein